MDIKGKTLDIMEAYHAKIAKTIQGLPNHASNIGACAALGWLPMKNYIERMCLLFLWRLLLLPMVCIFKQTLVFRFCCTTMKDGPHNRSIMEIHIHICKKCNVYNLLANGIEKGAYVTMI